MSEQINLVAVLPDELGGERCDQLAVRLFPRYSRSRLQTWIRTGALTVDGARVRPRDRLRGGETLKLEAILEETGQWLPEKMPLDILYEDEHLLIVNKPESLVVHPAAGHWQGTLLNGLLWHCPALACLPRAGIVHRLDQDTTGLMVVAKNLQAQNSLSEQLRKRSLYRNYEAVAMGNLTTGGCVDQPVGRHPVHRLKMAVVAAGKPAVTHYAVLRDFRAHTHLSLNLQTGRTHQIRVHMQHLGHPLVGDALYTGSPRIPREATPELKKVLQGFGRQALHARRLGLLHPATGDEMRWEAPLPADFAGLLAGLETDRQQAMQE
ncbi:MAG: 23S rRNA pseudouridine(1911/1915/1917) synthase RluD [Kistimonas sp.]|nr:23S rRNA pseudouridine(1911/1915/1917) synthase RluD [Kistimonas sp.]